MNATQKSILDLLKDKPRESYENIAKTLGLSLEETVAAIKCLEKDKVIIGYAAIVDWEKTDSEIVDALIEVRVTPQGGVGFDRIAKRIYSYPEVTSVYLMGGDYDFCVFIEKSSMKEVSRFVFEQLSTLPFVTGTSTHFVLKKYKEHGLVVDGDSEDRRMKVSV